MKLKKKYFRWQMKYHFDGKLWIFNGWRKERKVQNTAKAKKIHLSYSNFPCASLFFFVFVYMPFFDNMVSSSSLMKNISNHKKKTVKFVKTKPVLFIALNTTAQMKLISSIKKEQSAFQKTCYWIFSSKELSEMDYVPIYNRETNTYVV